MPTPSLLKGIRGRLLLLLLIVLGAVLLGEAVVYSRRFDIRKAEELEANLEVARAVGKNFETYLQDIVHSQLMIGLALTASRPLPELDRNRLLDQFQADNPAVRSVFWMTPDGVVTASSLRSYLGFDLSDRSFVQAIRAGREWAISELIVGKATGKSAFTIARGIRTAQGTLAGIVATAIEPDQLDSVLGMKRITTGGVSLVDNHGMLVYRYPPVAYTVEQRNWLRAYPIIAEALKGQDALARVPSPSTGKPRLVAFTPVPSVGWVATAGRGEEEVLAAIRTSLLWEAGAVLLVTVVGFAAALALAQPMVRGLIGLRQQAVALERGDMEQVTPVAGPAELTDLAAVFNHMAAAVRAREVALKASEQRWFTTLASIGDAVLTTDPAGRITFLNPVAEALTGWPQAEAVAQPVDQVFRLVNERTAAPVVDFIGRVLRDQAVIALANHTALVARDGQVIPIEDSAAPITDSTGQLVGVVVVFHDVTAKRRAQETLREQARILDLAHVLIQDPEGRITSWNAGAERLYGYTRAEAVGHVSHALLQTVFPSSQEAVDAALRTSGHWEGELIHTAKDGRRITVASHWVLYRDEAGTPRAILEVNNDITQLKQAEAAVSRSQKTCVDLVERSPFGTYVVDAEFRIALMNAASQEGAFRNVRPVIGRDFAEAMHTLWPEPVAADIIGHFRHTLDTGEPYCSPRFINPRHDVEVVEAYEWELHRMTLPDGQFGVICYYYDSTKLREAEGALQQAHAALEQRVQERTAALSSALQKVAFQSEQLRSLSSELTLVEQRERSKLAELIHDGLQQLLIAAKIQVNLVGRATDSRVQAGCREVDRLLDNAIADARSLTAELSPPILRTGGLLAGLDWLARWSREKHHLAVTVEAPPAAFPPLPEDLTVLLFQSVRELLFNSVKYAGVSEATVTLARAAQGWRITVADTGVGFDPHPLRGEGGTGGGFGLSRIRHRLELLGGCMDIDSAPGRGSRVTLAIPLVTTDQPSPSAPQVQPAAPMQRTPGPTAPRKIRVLLVDDHHVVRQALAQLILAEADIEVVGEAGTGTAAVVLAHQVAPDVVLMDVNMPEMNGIEATRAIHAAFPSLRVIGLSMHDRGDQEAAMRDAGAVDYLSKSAPAGALLAAIRKGW